MAANGSFVTQDLKGDEQAAAPAVESGSTNNSNLSKDEVGWYFVEQYYTTLSKTPEKLHVCCDQLSCIGVLELPADL